MKNFLKTLRSSTRTAKFGLVVVTIWIIVAVLAPLLAPYGVNEIDVASRLAPVSYTHLSSTAETHGIFPINILCSMPITSRGRSCSDSCLNLWRRRILTPIPAEYCFFLAEPFGLSFLHAFILTLMTLWLLIRLQWAAGNRRQGFSPI